MSLICNSNKKIKKIYLENHFKESVRFCSLREHVRGWKTLGLHNESDLVVFRRSRVQRPAQEEFGNDTAKGPHVDGLTESKAQDYFGSTKKLKVKNENIGRKPIVAWLQVRVGHCLTSMRCRSKVDDFDTEWLVDGVH